MFQFILYGWTFDVNLKNDISNSKRCSCLLVKGLQVNIVKIKVKCIQTLKMSKSVLSTLREPLINCMPEKND